MYNIGIRLEEICRTGKNYFVDKYFTRPIYKFCAKRLGPVAAAGIAFLSADLILHQFLPQAVSCLRIHVLNLEKACNMRWDPRLTIFWMCFAMPVMYVKYKRAGARINHA